MRGRQTNVTAALAPERAEARKSSHGPSHSPAMKNAEYLCMHTACCTLPAPGNPLIGLVRHGSPLSKFHVVDRPARVLARSTDCKPWRDGMMAPPSVALRTRQTPKAGCRSLVTTLGPKRSMCPSGAHRVRRGNQRLWRRANFSRAAEFASASGP